MLRKIIGIALSALLLTAASEASAVSLQKVDCSRISITLATGPDADWTECYRAHQQEQGERADGLQADFHLMLSDLGTHVLLIQTGKAGKSGYFFKESLESRLKDHDELEDRSDFAEEPAFEDYELVRFQAELWKKPADCVGFLKYTHASYTQGGGAGAGSYTFGYDCWREDRPDRATIETLLKSTKW